MIKKIKVIQGNPTEDELVALSLAIRHLSSQPSKQSSDHSIWQLANRMDKKPSPWMSSLSSPWSCSERMSEPWRD